MVGKFVGSKPIGRICNLPIVKKKKKDFILINKCILNDNYLYVLLNEGYTLLIKVMKDKTESLWYCVIPYNPHILVSFS